MASALRRFREEGYERAALDVDSGNPTGALGLYERAGFGVTRRSVTWSKPVRVDWAVHTPGGERFRLRTSRQGKRAEEGNDDLVNHPLQNYKRQHQFAL